MLFAIRLSTRNSLQCGILATRTAPASVHRRIVLEDLRDDRLAHRLRVGQCRLDESDVEGAGPLDEQRDLYISSGGSRSNEWAAGLCGQHAGRVCAPA